MLVGFGRSKVLLNGVKTFTLVGTPQYLAPELITCAGHSLPVDCWALGVLLYEMLHGAPPFDDASPMGVYKKILAGKVLTPRLMLSVAPSPPHRNGALVSPS